MAFCPQCGKQVSDDAGFCASCGAAIPPSGTGASVPTPPPPAPPSGMQPPPPTPQPPAAVPPAQVPGVVPPPPGKQRMGSGWKIALIIILIALLVIGAGVAVLAVFVFKTVKEPVDVTNRYIEAINDGDAQEAWSLLHPDSRFRREYTEGSFEREIVRPYSNALRTWNAHDVDISGSRASVKVDMELKEGDQFEATFELRKDGGDWLIFDYTY